MINSFLAEKRKTQFFSFQSETFMCSDTNANVFNMGELNPKLNFSSDKNGTHDTILCFSQVLLN